MVGQVRRFNRTVTQRIGALDDAFLARGRPLGQARLLWEIGPDGSDVRLLRSRLDLDSGYLSLLLRSLEHDGLVVVRQSGTDGRVRTAHLTGGGLAERAELDRRSDDAAMSILRPLSARQRTRLISAMAEVERLLLASTVQISVCDPRHPDARSCLRAYFSELAHRFDGGFDPARSIPADDEELTPPAGLLLVATLHAGPVGCAALKFHGDAPAEIKRMWVSPTVRRSGSAACSSPTWRRTRQPTGSAPSGWKPTAPWTKPSACTDRPADREVTAFNDEPYAHHWFEKTLGHTNP